MKENRDALKAVSKGIKAAEKQSTPFQIQQHLTQPQHQQQQPPQPERLQQASHSFSRSFFDSFKKSNGKQKITKTDDQRCVPTAGTEGSRSPNVRGKRKTVGFFSKSLQKESGNQVGNSGGKTNGKDAGDKVENHQPNNLKMFYLYNLKFQ